MKYKIGDVIKVRDDLQEDKMYGKCSSIDDMLKFRGTTDIIKDIDSDGDYRLANNNNPYVWSEEMLEPVTVADDLKQYTHVSNMKYKIGDIVKIKDNLQEGKEYGECDISEGMLKFRGTLNIIENIDEDGNYHLTNNNYTWSKGMLELVAIYSCRENKGE